MTGKYPTTVLERARCKLSPHQWKVYDFLLTIPAGRVTTYGIIASAIHSSPQAVGGALRENPFQPEGHTLDSDKGKITIARKHALLLAEGVKFDEGVLVGELLFGTYAQTR